jgi:hypothetical protein
MYGPSDVTVASTKNNDSMGMIPRAIHEIFESMADHDKNKTTVYCSFVQIYNEGLYDMLW